MGVPSITRRTTWAALALAAGLAALSACGGMPGSAAGPLAASDRKATLARSALTSSVSATGNIQAESETRLAFQQPGRVAEVTVDVGSVVKKGDVLARLDTTDLNLALAQAQASLIAARSGYSRTVESARPADIKAAEAALNAANAGYNRVKQGADQADVDAALASVSKAEADLRSAQHAYDVAARYKPNTLGDNPVVAQLEQARNNLQAAQLQLQKATQGADNAQVASAVQQIQDARARLEKLKEPAQTFDVQSAEAQLTRAELAVQQAQRRLDKAVLVAPLDGVVSSVSIDLGEMVGTQPVLALVDNSQFHIDVKVDEIDVARVQPGQEVQVTLDALAGVEVKGSIDQIAPTSTTANGIVSYAVRIVLAPSDAPLRAGMTANAAIVLDRREGVLLAPNWAVRRQGGKSYLTVLGADGKSREVEVQVGARNDTQTEIVSGASEGQVVVSPQAAR